MRSVLNSFKALAEAEQEAIREEFAKAQKVAAMKRSFARGGIDTPLIRPAFAEYLASRHGRGSIGIQMPVV